jgi:hypothetical protein
LVGQLDRGVTDRTHASAEDNLNTSGGQLSQRVLGQIRTDLRHDSGARAHQDHPNFAGLDIGIETRRGTRKIVQLGYCFGPGESSAGYDELSIDRRKVESGSMSACSKTSMM